MRFGWYLGLLVGFALLLGAGIQLLVMRAWAWGLGACAIYAGIVAYALLYRPWRHPGRSLGRGLLPAFLIGAAGLALLASSPLGHRFTWGGAASFTLIMLVFVITQWRRVPYVPGRNLAPRRRPQASP